MCCLASEKWYPGEMKLEELGLNLVVKGAVSKLKKENRSGAYCDALVDWQAIAHVISNLVQSEVGPEYKAKIISGRDGLELRISKN